MAMADNSGAGAILRLTGELAVPQPWQDKPIPRLVPQPAEGVRHQLVVEDGVDAILHQMWVNLCAGGEVVALLRRLRDEEALHQQGVPPPPEEVAPADGPYVAPNHLPRRRPVRRLHVRQQQIP
mmetsp:Transcript_19356/g.54512  ORF Transcript_19356/g.54512 Transcript_19356/m.54512 type:complete len:124 (-) Transcript_19356:693-1064(-)